MSEPDTGTRIIGIGSPFGADRAGWAAVEYLERCGWARTHPAVELVVLDRPGPALVNHFDGPSRVILVDALQGGRAGHVRRVVAEDLACDGSGSSHGLGVADALALADALGLLPEQLLILAIETGDASDPDGFDFAPLAEELNRLMSRGPFPC